MRFDVMTSKAQALWNGRFDVSFDDLGADLRPLRAEIDAEMDRVFSLKGFWDYQLYVREFESSFAEFCGTSYAVGVGSGTAALSFAFLALGIQPGDEVIIPGHTYVATGMALVDIGARPVFADIGQDFNLDPLGIKEKITGRTKAVCPVHIYGNPCAMEEITSIAREHGLLVVEDAAQAHGAEIQGKKAGGWGHCGCFSFHPSKIIGGTGDGGIVTTRDKNVVHKIKRFRELAYHDELSLLSRRTPSRLDAGQIPFLKVKLRHYEDLRKKRARLAAIYDDQLAGVVHIQRQQNNEQGRPALWHYAIRVERSEELIKALAGKGLELKSFFPVSVPLREEMKGLNYRRGACPVCDDPAQKIVSLPLRSSLTEDQAQRIAKAVKVFYQQ